MKRITEWVAVAVLAVAGLVFTTSTADAAPRRVAPVHAAYHRGVHHGPGWHYGPGWWYNSYQHRWYRR